MSVINYKEMDELLTRAAYDHAASVLGIAAETALPESLTRKIFDLVRESYIAGGFKVMQQVALEEAINNAKKII